MSWLRSAVNKAVEVGNKNNLTRAVKNYADSVVQQAGQAVAEGAKILQHHIVNRNYKSAKQTIKRLEEAAVSCRDVERLLLLKRWLFVLKEIDRLSAEEKQNVLEQADDDEKDRKPSMVLYYDSDIGGAPMNFREVFLQSQALEGITLSMIIEPPNDEEISLLLEMFGLCLTGGKEVHNAILSSIQDLATAFASYQEEVLVKREELLQFAQGAISGLKLNADVGRIDAETLELKKKLDKIVASEKLLGETQDKASDESTKANIEVLKEALAKIRISSSLEGLLLRKKNINFGDSPEVHAQKVDKLKVLSESLANSSSKTEKRILDHRLQKEEALKVRVSKADECNEKEKEIVAEITGLEKQRDELEAQLKKVNISLAAANARLRNAKEERDHFDEANDQIVEHLKTKEDELSKTVAASKVEADVIGTWINFLEDTWVLQRAYAETQEKQVKDELEKHEEYFLNLATSLLSGYKSELELSINQIGTFAKNLKNLSEGEDHGDSKALNPRKNLEEEYLEYEAKIIATLSVVNNMREQFYAQQGAFASKDDSKVKELFDDIEKLSHEFESIERPNLEMEILSPILSPRSGTASEKQADSPILSPRQGSSPRKSNADEHPETPTVEQALDPAAELAKLESEFGKSAQDYSAEEIGDWEFDELERELKAGDTATS